MAFRRGDDVEFLSKESGFEGSYYEAVVITPLSNNDYIVQYKTLSKEDDQSMPLRAFANAAELRPLPPVIPATGFLVGDMVDAFHNDGWWVGKISRKSRGKYCVYFETAEEENKYYSDELRVHQDWVDGKWVSSIQA